MGNNVSVDGAPVEAEVFHSYRIPQRAYKKKNDKPLSPIANGSNSANSSNSAPNSPITSAANSANNSTTNNNNKGKQRVQYNNHPQYGHGQQRTRSGSMNGQDSRYNPKRERPVSFPSIHSSPSSSSLSISTFGLGSSSGIGGPSTGGGFIHFSNSPQVLQSSASSITSGSWVDPLMHQGALPRPTVGGGGNSGGGIGNGLYFHSNYTVQEFMSYQQQQQQQFMEQQQKEYFNLLQLQQQQLQQQQLQLQQHQQQQQFNTTPQQIYNGITLQTKGMRPARHPDRTNSHPSISNPSATSLASSKSIAVSATGNYQHHKHRPDNIKSQPLPMTNHNGPRSPTMAYSQSTSVHSFGTSPSNSLGQSSFSSQGSLHHYHPMLAMTVASPPSSSASSLGSNHGTSGQGTRVVVGGGGGEPTVNTTTTTTTTVPLSIDALAAELLPPRRIVVGREYHPDRTLPYLLPCDDEEGERLQLQHYVLRYAFGSNILPPIDLTQPDLKLLDCGCGPGTWAMELSTEYPDLDVFAFDISPMYPSTIHPRNCHFANANLLDSTIPYESDTFHLVHQRNLLLGLTADAWPGVIQDLYRCVVSGGSGFLQLSEIDPIWCRPGPVSKTVLNMLYETAKIRNVDVMIPQQLDQLLIDQGCENVKMTSVEIPIGAWGGKLGLLWRDVLKAEMEALKTVVLQSAVDKAIAEGADIAVCGAEMITVEEWEEMMKQVWQEMDGYHTYSRVYVAYGQKP